MHPNDDQAMLRDFTWNPPVEEASREQLRAQVFGTVVWFGLCGMMLSALLGTEKFLLHALSVSGVTTLCLVFCGLGIFFAAGGSFRTIRLFLRRGQSNGRG